MPTRKLWPFLVKCRNRFLHLEIKIDPTMTVMVETDSDPITITGIAQAPIHLTVIATIVESEATELKIVGLDKTVTIILTTVTIETDATTTTTTTTTITRTTVIITIEIQMT